MKFLIICAALLGLAAAVPILQVTNGDGANIGEYGGGAIYGSGSTHRVNPPRIKKRVREKCFHNSYS